MGICGYCEREFSVAGMTRHLSTCPHRKRVLSEADRGRAPVYSMTGDYESATKDHDEAVRLDPGNERARLGRATAGLLSSVRDLTPEDSMRTR